MGCHLPLQGIFLTQRWKPHLLPPALQAGSRPAEPSGKSCQLLGKAFWVNSGGKWSTCYADNKDADSSQRKLQVQRSRGRIRLSHWRSRRSTQFLSTLLTPHTWGLLATPVSQLSVLQLSSGTAGEGPHSIRLFPLQHLPQVGACPSDQLGIIQGVSTPPSPGPQESALLTVLVYYSKRQRRNMARLGQGWHALTCSLGILLLGPSPSTQKLRWTLSFSGVIDNWVTGQYNAIIEVHCAGMTD